LVSHTALDLADSVGVNLTMFRAYRGRPFRRPLLEEAQELVQDARTPERRGRGPGFECIRRQLQRRCRRRPYSLETVPRFVRRSRD
jgi:hypothetical protein